MSALEHLSAVDRELTATFYRAARALTPWPADVERPTDDDLDACERLVNGFACGRCGVALAETFPAITAEEAAGLPPFLGKPRTARPAFTAPASSMCHCSAPGAMWPIYEAMLARWPAQHALRLAHEQCSDLLPPQLRDLIVARWIDREAVLATLGGKATVEDAECRTITWRIEEKRQPKNNKRVKVATITCGNRAVEIRGERHVSVFRQVAEAAEATPGQVVLFDRMIDEVIAAKLAQAGAALDLAEERRLDALQALERDDYAGDDRRRLAEENDLDARDEVGDTDLGENTRPRQFEEASRRIGERIRKEFPSSICEWERPYGTGGVRLVVGEGFKLARADGA